MDPADDVTLEMEKSRSKRRSLNPRWLSRQMGLREQDQSKRMNLQVKTSILIMRSCNVSVLGLPHLAVQAGCPVPVPLTDLSPGSWPQPEEGDAPHVGLVSSGLHLDNKRKNGDDN